MEEGNEGQDLAQFEKKIHNFETDIRDKIDRMKEGEESIVTEYGLSITVEKRDEGFTLNLFGEDIATIKDGNFSYNIKALEEVKGKLEKSNSGNPVALYEDLGLPDIEYLKELQKEQEKKEDAQENEQEEQGDTEKADKEPELEEEKEKEKEEDGKEKSQEKQEKEIRKKHPSVVPLNYKIVSRFLPDADQYSSIGINSEGQIVGKNKETGETEPVRSIVKKDFGTPDKEIHGEGKSGHEHINAEIIYRINGNSKFGLAIDKDLGVQGNNNVKLVSFRTDENKKEGIIYYNVPLLESQGKMGNMQLKDQTGERGGIRSQNRADYVLDKVDELEKEDSIPDEIKKNLEESLAKDDKLITEPSEFEEILKESILEELDNRGMSEDNKDWLAGKMAHEIAIEGKSSEDVWKEYMGENVKDEEENEKLPGQNPLKRNH